MRVFLLLFGAALSQLVNCASFAGKEDGYAAFMAETGRGPLFGHAIRELTAANPGHVIADTGIGAGKFWRRDPDTGNVEDVSDQVANFSVEDRETLETFQALWATEEENLQNPSLTPEEEVQVRKIMAEWNTTPHPLHHRRKASTLNLRGKEVTQEQYHAILAEATAEFGELEVPSDTAMSVRDTAAANFLDPITIVGICVFAPYVLAAVAGVAVVGGAVGGIMGLISHHKKHRKKKQDKADHPGETKSETKERHRQEKEDKKQAKKDEKERKKEEKKAEKERKKKEKQAAKDRKEGNRKQPPAMRFEKRQPGVTVWKTAGKTTPIFSVTEMEQQAVADAAA